MIKNELLKDPTVESVAVTVTRIAVAGMTTWTIDIAVPSGAGPFELIVAASSVSVELLGVR